MTRTCSASIIPSDGGKAADRTRLSGSQVRLVGSQVRLGGSHATRPSRHLGEFGLAQHVQRRPWLRPEFHALRQWLREGPAGGDDDVKPWIARFRDMRELDPVHAACKLNIGNEETQRAARYVEDVAGVVSAFTLDDVIAALLQQKTEHLPL